MQLVPSLLFGVSASLDALLVGVSFGLRGVHIRLSQNLFISLITLLGTCLSVSVGGVLSPLLPPAAGTCVGSLVLALLGVYYIAKWMMAARRHKTPDHCLTLKNPDLTLAEHFPPGLSLPELFALSLTLSANNLGIGLSASMAGLSLLSAAAATFVCSVLFLYLGNGLGRCRILRLIGGLADPISGILLINLALIQLFL